MLKIRQQRNHKSTGRTFQFSFCQQVIDQILKWHCFAESLRLYPPAGLFFRECTKDYPIPDTDIVLQKGTIVWIPSGSLGRDPEYFQNPDSFQPERFSPEEKAKRDPFCHLPFGEGPRICIGKYGSKNILTAFT